MIELEDCAADLDDSDVLLDNGISAIGQVNSLLPRFEPDGAASAKDNDCDS